MHAKIIVGALVTVGIVLLAVLAFLSSGPPGAPTATNSQAPDPTASHTYTVTVEFAEKSLVTPSYFGWGGQASVVSAYWQVDNGVHNLIVQNQHDVVSVLSSSGDTYVLSTTFSFTIGSQSSTSCATTVLNISVTAYGINPMGAAWSSATGPASTVVFSNVGVYNTAPSSVPAAPTGTYYAELLGSITGIFVVALAGATAFKPNWYTAVGTGVAAVVLAAEVVVLVVL